MSSKKNNVIILIFSVLVCMFMFARNSWGLFSALYGEPGFRVSISYYGYQFWSFAMISSLLNLRFTSYLEQYAACLVVRNNNRKAIYSHFQKLIIKKTVLFEVWKCAIFSLGVLLFFGKIRFEDVLGGMMSFTDILFMIIIFVLMEIMLLSIMMFLEVFVHQKFAWIFILSYFLISFWIGDILIGTKIPDAYHLFFLPSLAMNYRLIDLDIAPSMIIAVELIVIIFTYFGGSIMITKKDIL